MKIKTPAKLAAAREWQKIYRASPEGQAYYSAYRKNPEVLERKKQLKQLKRRDRLIPDKKFASVLCNFKYSLKEYNLNIDDWHRLIIEQSGRCALCFLPMNPNNREPTVDHCHRTGKVRGLLHSVCNSGIGQFGDSIERLQQAIQYLVSHVG